MATFPYDSVSAYDIPSGGAGAGTLPYKDLANEANQFMTGQAMAPYLANLPNYANMIGQRSANTTQQLSGQLPQDVINQIAQQSAERGIATGTSGSPNSNAAYLRALGLNSLGMMQQGSQNLSQSIADTPVPELWNPMALHVPMMIGQAEQAAGRAAAGGYGRPTGAGSGPQTASVAGMPNLGARFLQYSNPGEYGGVVTASGPSWGTASTGGFGGGGLFAGDAPQGSGGGWTGSYFDNAGDNFWNYGGGQSPAYDQYGGSNADFGQFAEEDAYFENMA